jgi:hypothetical protein
LTAKPTESTDAVSPDAAKVLFSFASPAAGSAGGHVTSPAVTLVGRHGPADAIGLPLPVRKDRRGASSAAFIGGWPTVFPLSERLRSFLFTTAFVFVFDCVLFFGQSARLRVLSVFISCLQYFLFHGFLPT